MWITADSWADERFSRPSVKGSRHDGYGVGEYLEKLSSEIAPGRESTSGAPSVSLSRSVMRKRCASALLISPDGSLARMEYSERSVALTILPIVSMSGAPRQNRFGASKSFNVAGRAASGPSEARSCASSAVATAPRYAHDVADRVPPIAYAFHDRYSACPGYQRVYRDGTQGAECAKSCNSPCTRPAAHPHRAAWSSEQESAYCWASPSRRACKTRAMPDKFSITLTPSAPSDISRCASR